MKTLVCTAPGQLQYIESEKPQLKKGFSLLKIKRIGICGTDLHAFEGTQPFFAYPRVLGHELGCEIADVDPSTGFSIGERVTLIPYFNCGKMKKDTRHSVLYFTVSNFTHLIERIIPFFQEHKILGVKFLDYED